MNFKDSFKRNDYNILSIIIFSVQALIFYFIFMRGRERGGRERESEWERREKRGEREREGIRKR